MRSSLLFVLIPLLSLCFWSCSTPAAQRVEAIPTVTKVAQQAASNLPTRRQLRQAFREKRKIRIVYGSQLPAFVEQNKQLAELNRDRLQGFNVEIFSDQEIAEDSLGTLPLALIGSPQSNSVLRKIQSQLPFS